MKYFIIIATITATFMFGIVQVFATVQPQERGTWDYGVDRSLPFRWVVWSNFHHPTRIHGSSCKNGEEGHSRSALISPGSWDYAHRGATISGNQSFYRFSD